MIGDWNEIAGYVGPLLAPWEHSALEMPAADPAPAALVSPASSAATWQRWDHSWPLYVPAFPSPELSYQAGQIIELARAVIPWGMIGKLTRIDTAVIDGTTGNAADWSNPLRWIDSFDFFLVSNMEYDATIRDRLIAIDPGVPYYVVAGGVPVGRFGVWDDSRFSWGNPSNEIDQPIPAGSIIRLFARSLKDIDFPHRLKGRLCWSYAAETSFRSVLRAQL